MRAMRFATLPLACMFIFSFTIPLAHVRASPEEPTLIAILNTLGFTNIMETTVETFPAGEYEATLYAEFAGSHASNELSWYTIGTSEYHVIFSGPEGGPHYVIPPLTKRFVADSEFGLSFLSPHGRYFSEVARNPDGVKHALVLANSDNPSMFLVGFENLWGGGDFDYQDMVISLKRVSLLDTTPPVSGVDPIEPYWQLSAPFTVTAQATDDLSGVAWVELQYRYSLDNSTWQDWRILGIDTYGADGWSWSFTAPEGYGYYEFYSIATDVAGNIEEPPAEADTRCHYWHDMLMITNKQKLIEFARATGEADPEGKVGELLRVARGTHPEGVLVFLDERLENPMCWQEIDDFIEDFVYTYGATVHLTIFGQQLSVKIPFTRYLMILGGPEVVPFYVTSDPTGDEENVATDSLYGDVGNDYYQDIAVGRIVGINIEGMINLIRNATPPYYQTSSLAIVSCGDEELRDTTDAMRDSLLGAGFSQNNILYLKEDDPEWGDKYIEGLPNRAIIVHEGHGNPWCFGTTKGKGKSQTWDYLWGYDVRNRGLGTTNPVIYGGGCHTAFIEEGDIYYTISMSFLGGGATSFVGSTRLSYFHPWFSWYSEIIGRELVKHLADGDDIGFSLMRARNSVGGWFTSGDVNRKTWLEFVLYGDPKFNPQFPRANPVSSPPMLSSSIELTVEIPEYSRTTIDEYDVITIPKAQFLFDPGYPLVPIFVEELKLERGQQVAAVELIDAEIEKIENVRLLIDQAKSSVQLPELEYPVIGLYPGFTHSLGVYEHPDGYKTIQLTIAPLQYDKAREEAYLYRSMRFRLVAEPSAISATPAYWRKSVELRKSVGQEFSIRNLGAEALEIELEAMGGVEKYTNFDISRFILLPGETNKITATFIANEVGSYTGEILVRSAEHKQSIPVAMMVFAPAPRVEITKEFRPSQIHESRRGAIMPYTTITNVSKVDIVKLEIFDEFLEGWVPKKPMPISVSYFDNENNEYGVSKHFLEISLTDRGVRMSADFTGGIEIKNGKTSKVIYSLGENEKIVLKYPMHPIQRPRLGLHEAWVSANVLGPEGSRATMEAFALLKVVSK